MARIEEGTTVKRYSDKTAASVIAKPRLLHPSSAPTT